jgi:hypothetical protein
MTVFGLFQTAKLLRENQSSRLTGLRVKTVSGEGRVPDRVRRRLGAWARQFFLAATGGSVTAERSEESSPHRHLRQDSSLRSVVVNLCRVRETHHNRSCVVRFTHPTDCGRADAEAKDSQPLRMTRLARIPCRALMHRHLAGPLFAGRIPMVSW